MYKYLTYLTCFFLMLGLFSSNTASAIEEIWGEAELADSITPPLQVGDDYNASGFKYIAVEPGNDSSPVPPTDGIATYSIEIVEGGAYAMYLRLRCEEAGNGDDSLWVRMQGATYNPTVDSNDWIRANNINDQIANPQEWFWKQLGHYQDYPGNVPIEMIMDPGTYTLEIAYREDGLWIDAFLITNDPNVDDANLPDETPAAPAKPAKPTDEGLVAYYALENDVNDSSPNGFDGVIETVGDVNEAATFVEGIEGMAIDLLPTGNGTQGSYVNCGADPNFDLVDAMTVGAWVNIRSIPDEWRGVVCKGDSAWRLATQGATTKFEYAIAGYGTRPAYAVSGAIEVAFDEWHYVCGTYDTIEGVKLYVDGVLDGTLEDLTGISVNTYDVTIGANLEDTSWKPYRLFDGMLDEVRIYGKALVEEEVMFLSGLRWPPKPEEAPGPQPIHSYTFEDGTADDSVGDADGLLIGDANVVSGSLILDGVDDWMEMPGDIIAINTLEAVTIEAWYTPTEGANTGFTMLAAFGLTNPFQDWMGVDYLFITTARGDDVSRAAIGCNNYEDPWATESGVNGPEYDDGLLHHMVATVNATEIAFYIDGVLMGTAELTGDNHLANVSNEQAYLGKGPYGNDPEWAGAIHEFNIYDYALSAEDILGLYDAGY